jgi:cyclopropane fatty-acyl-phospholipid synthase-like methyltransferase
MNRVADAIDGARDDDGAAFHIDTSLLADAPARWSNLGYWRATDIASNVATDFATHTTKACAVNDYATACANLARLVARGAALQPGEQVLELACGDGAGLALWQQEFGAAVAAGIELRSDAIAALRQRGVPHVYHASMCSLPLPAGISAQAFDAVLCVDAAYHAESLTAFARVAHSALIPGGRLAFTTFTRAPGWQEGSLLTRVFARLLAAADVPLASVPAVADVHAQLHAAGFSGVQVSHHDDAVLAGFARHVQARAAQLPWHRRSTPGWWKIRATAVLCRFAQRHALLHYSLVCATSSPHGFTAQP